MDSPKKTCFRKILMIVDIHAHYFPQAYNDILMRIGGRSLPEAARLINDSYAELATQYPGRLAAFVSLPRIAVPGYEVSTGNAGSVGCAGASNS